MRAFNDASSSSPIGFEQIAQDVQRVGSARFARAEAREVFDDVRARIVEVQI
jgi:hypothetical protein